MSTKNTIKFEEDKATRQIVHLYAEAFDEDHTYLAFEGFHFEAASSMRLSGEWGPRLTLTRFDPSQRGRDGVSTAEAPQRLKDTALAQNE